MWVRAAGPGVTGGGGDLGPLEVAGLVRVGQSPFSGPREALLAIGGHLGQGQRGPAVSWGESQGEVGHRMSAFSKHLGDPGACFLLFLFFSFFPLSLFI